MSMLSIYNSLTKKIESFEPNNPSLVTLYACGPTVYDYAHIGNFRTYIATDIVVRTLQYMGYSTNYVMNITDVGHLTSDSDTGEDKLEKGAKREGKSAWDIAKFYENAFLSDWKKLHLIEPNYRPKPTELIKEQIVMVQELIDKGYGYIIDDGVYFDTSKSSSYGFLAGQTLEELKAGARIEINIQKRNPLDFALWKFSPKGEKRQMEWSAPWGPKGENVPYMGFPGWHIECSVMSRKYLGDQIDIHTGGIDLLPIHHTNEIAQSEAVTGKIPFVKYWIHGGWLLVENEKMSKSKGNFYRLQDLIDKGFDSMSLRYLFFTGHYRKPLNLTLEALGNAQKSYEELKNRIVQISDVGITTQTEQTKPYKKKFEDALSHDFNTPQALAVLWEVLRSNLAQEEKKWLCLDFDTIFGFGFSDMQKTIIDIPQDIQLLANKRGEYRRDKEFSKADEMRKLIQSKGFDIIDTPEGSKIILLTSII
jgi:cysteinyl-tRNA synthetase